ncbi:MAG: heavy-metal-associated domain-containing protein, partial [Bacteroidales bacterium]|nr:heavy-metal-associated domain-containing protein [Bacteroidales bacterium]
MKKTILILTVMLFAGITSMSAQEETKKETKANSKISEVSLVCNMACNSCATKVKKQLAFTKGITDVQTDYEKDIVTVKYRNDKTDTDKIIASLAEIDYQAKVKTDCPSTTKAKTGCPGATSKTGCAGSTAKTGCAETTAKTGCSGTTAKTG